MAFDLVPKSFWAFPSLKPWFEDEDWLGTLPTSSSGLTVSEDDKNVYVEANMPGLKAEDIEVTFHKGELWVHGNRKEEEKDKQRKYYRMASSEYSYRILVPGEIEDKAEPVVNYKDGILSAIFKKVPKAQPKRISVKKG